MRHLFYNAHVLTQDDQQPVASAFIVENGKYIAVGNAELLQADVAQKTDLNSATVIPGFHDAHMHLWKVGNLRTHMLDVRHVQSLEELQEMLRIYADAHPELSWIQARGFNEMNFPTRKMPDKNDLDKVIPDRPVVLTRTCAHQIIANSQALMLSNLNRHTQSPAGGEISYLPDGELSGHFTETAIGLVLKAIPKYTSDAFREMILSAQQACLEVGITTVTDPAVDRDLLAVYKKMHADGELKIRVHAIPIRVPDGKNTVYPNPELFSGENLIVNTVKFFADGGLSGKTAALNKPYTGSNSTGVLRFDFDTLLPLARASQEAGFMIATHAIGDAAIDVVLKVYEAIDGKQHRIEHLGLPSQFHLATMHKRQIAAVMQPIFIRELGHNFIDALDTERLEHLYPVKTVLQQQIPLALSTDAPVVTAIDPWININSAITRQTLSGQIIGASEAITQEEAIRAYTLGSAQISGCGGVAGSVKVGKQADFQCLESLNRPKLMAVYINGNPIK